jgi:phage terminase Nu1 subunit (DNA packaging protein)
MSEAVAVAPRIVGKKALCAEVLHWSRMRLERRLEADPEFPVVRRGTQAGGWAFDADAVLAYLGASVDEPEDAAPVKVAHQPEDAAPAAPVKVVHQAEETARSRLNAAQAQLAEDKLRERRGELVEAAPLRMALAETMTKVTTGLNSLPDVLVRRLNLPATATEIIRQEIDGVRRNLVLGLREQLGDG